MIARSPAWYAPTRALEEAIPTRAAALDEQRELGTAATRVLVDVARLVVVSPAWQTASST